MTRLYLLQNHLRAILISPLERYSMKLHENGVTQLIKTEGDIVTKICLFCGTTHSIHHKEAHTIQCSCDATKEYVELFIYNITSNRKVIEDYIEKNQKFFIFKTSHQCIVCKSREEYQIQLQLKEQRKVEQIEFQKAAKEQYKKEEQERKLRREQYEKEMLATWAGEEAKEEIRKLQSKVALKMSSLKYLTLALISMSEDMQSRDYYGNCEGYSLYLDCVECEELCEEIKSRL